MVYALVKYKNRLFKEKYMQTIKSCLVITVSV